MNKCLIKLEKNGMKKLRRIRIFTKIYKIKLFGLRKIKVRRKVGLKCYERTYKVIEKKIKFCKIR
jgi:hypothetical protein